MKPCKELVEWLQQENNKFAVPFMQNNKDVSQHNEKERVESYHIIKGKHGMCTDMWVITKWMIKKPEKV